MALPEPEAFDWEGTALEIPYEECIFYHIHARGFTRHATSGWNPFSGDFRGLWKDSLFTELGDHSGSSAAGGV